ncbi:FecCD family ABC transporter permease [Gordonia liuliyuniae]|uniref:Iron chelate uptake ABC transporter family permease subunit n=1 Tax=Gordonia liuliyuniae TaxID=2911517 RepID=A0ABS9IV25_9ACTN|nr:iron chelate uptake ABC transporter family permease subunit [Gordonia liuliyuniae]MCF8589403.1 iron chelate uptake ABC transporter family permease subunit [Gordonia liuliyuniae]
MTARTAVRSRIWTVNLLAIVVIVVCIAVSLMVGRSGLTIADIVELLTGRGSARDRLVFEWRAPRALAAPVFGACLGVSGMIFQSLTRNALGSPDVIGLNSGAYTGVIIVLMVGGSGFGEVAVGAVVGSIVAAFAVFVFAYRGGLAGFRLIIVGIAVSAVLSSFNQWFAVRADLDESMRAAIWGAGSLNGMTWAPLVAVTCIALVMACVLGPLSHVMRAFELGEETAASLGVRVERAKLVMVLVGVVFTAIVTAVAGPIAFVSLAAPQIAKRLVRSPSLSVTGSALVGAAVLAVGDLTAQHLLGDVSPPVGAVTVTLGGLYLIRLLLKE